MFHLAQPGPLVVLLHTPRRELGEDRGREGELGATMAGRPQISGTEGGGMPWPGLCLQSPSPRVEHPSPSGSPEHLAAL